MQDTSHTNRSPNHLSQETSPYLLQHLYNPVDWYPWSEEALARARAEDKPILVSIGYSACHWCHVMERESFENQAVADYMNQHYVCIKVDREERPDLDNIYMEACQIVSGSGGWPLNCFLTPEAIPFYAGTYFPPQAAHQRPSWMEVLRNLHNAFTNQRETVETQAQRLLGYLQAGESVMLKKADERAAATQDVTFTQLYGDRLFHEGLTEQIFYGLRERFDRLDGGFGYAPKFPGLMAIQYLLEYAHFRSNDEALLHAVFSLERMLTGGIYDQLGGGLARYSVDNEWLAPHFEKMLYDNALLIQTLAHAIRMIESAEQWRGKDLSHLHSAVALFKVAIKDTYDWSLRDINDPATGAWQAALDADSEGVEGKYYIWSKAEVMLLLGDYDGARFCDWFDVTEGGNWEHTNILRRLSSATEWSAKWADGAEWLRTNLPKAIQTLLQTREKRIPPGLDDKVLLSWNAMMVSACTHAYRATGNADMLAQACRCTSFLLTAFRGTDGRFLHTYKKGVAKYAAMLDDYAYLIAALLDLYEVCGHEPYAHEAAVLMQIAETDFTRSEDAMFYYTSVHQTDVIVRKTDFYDNATPSGNAVMAHNLQRLGQLYSNTDWLQRADAMLTAMRAVATQHPLSFAHWSVAMQRAAHQLAQVAICGPDAPEKRRELAKAYIPQAILATDHDGAASLPLLEGKFVAEDTLIYICRDFACERPSDDVAEVVSAL